MNEVEKSELGNSIPITKDLTEDIELTQVRVHDNQGIANPDFNKDSSNIKHNCCYSGSIQTSQENHNCFRHLYEQFQQAFDKNRLVLKKCLYLTLTVAYFIYFGFAIHLSWSLSESWCHGSRLLTVMTSLTTGGIVYFQVIKRYFGRTLNKFIVEPFIKVIDRITAIRFSSLIAFLGLMGFMVAFILVDCNGNYNRVTSYAGIWVLLLLGFVFSKHPDKIIIRHVTWGIGLQFVFALMSLRWKVGRDIFQCLGDKAAAFLAFTDKGTEFVFSYLSSGKLASGKTNLTLIDPVTLTNSTMVVDLVLPDQLAIFTFKILPVVIVFSFWVSIFYYYGIMQWIVQKVGWLLQITIGTTAAESFNAAGNIFLGQTESPLLIKPYIHLMTKSELHAIMTGGFATISGAVLAAFISLGVSASHLLSASVMSAPAALGYSKLLYPESEISRTTASTIRIEKRTEQNALEAASVGVTQSIMLVGSIVASVIAITAFVYFIDYVLMWFGSLVGWDFLSFTYLAGKVLMPLAYVMGVPWDECDIVGELIGIKVVLNEFIAYDALSKLKNRLSWRSQIIATYALCGFANLASIGVQLGCLASLAPSKLSDLSAVAFRAMISGAIASFLTACIAGALLDEDRVMNNT